ncbi:MAG: MogA/MoaB family molybdenum cofactor biosynthesis protein [Syntrophales bacterium]|nr:MogA/MoaB family molybdenum cofactor biosynthesis protein [Syntrophales bacterium]MDY0043527.1 MogA/MoaB family molybdenum cofactor biosynthesis protein [Syntrophales bacterium]
MISAGVITVSDRGARGEREDISGKEITSILSVIPAEVKAYCIIPDEKEAIKEAITKFVDEKRLDLVITTGGTGVSPRDVTPDATLEVIEKQIPGMAEAMRLESAKKTPHAMISRAVAGIRKESIIINLPGSPRGVKENLSVLVPALKHAIDKVKGDPSDCAS